MSAGVCPPILALFQAFLWSVSLLLSTKATSQAEIKAWSSKGRTWIDLASQELRINQQNGKTVSFVAESHSIESDKAGRTIRINGKLGPLSATITCLDQSDTLTLDLLLEPSAKENWEISGKLEWTLPLKLDHRKQIWLQGDYGIPWQSRYFYQFVATPSSHWLAAPDTNEWRYFGLDQLSPTATRLWKQESRHTAPLLMEEGSHALPAVQIFDQWGGLTVEFPMLRAHPPSQVEIDAANSGVLRKKMDLAMRTHSSALRDQIVLTSARNQFELESMRKAITAKYPAKRLPTPHEITEEAPWIKNTAPSVSFPQFATGGYPFGKGELHDHQQIAVYHKEKRLPLQSKPLAWWPDGSIKWALLTFPFRAENSISAATNGPRVTLRQQSHLPIQVRIEEPDAPKFAHAINARYNAQGEVEIENGFLSIVFGSGDKWIRSLSYNGRALLNHQSSERLAYTDYWMTDQVISPYGSPSSNATLDRGTLSIERVDLEETGPLRAVVRLEGLTNNSCPTRIILRATLHAGRPEIDISHTAIYRFHDPRQTFLAAMGLSFPFALQADQRATVSIDGRQKHLHSTTLTQHTHTHQELQLSDETQAWNSSVPADPAKGWIFVTLGDTSVMGYLRDFHYKAPLSVGWSQAENTLKFEFWPRNSAPMDVRRYSNYPHLAQGESTTHHHNWVERDYYTSDPFYGIARTHEIRLVFGCNSDEADSIAADFQSPPLIYAGWKRYADTGVILPAADQAVAPTAWASWSNLSRFFLWHQSVYRWYGKWNYGDFRHRFQTGYGWIAAPEVLLDARPWESESKRAPADKLTLDYKPSNDWAYDNGRWGWSNTEGLPNLFLQQEYLRHGNRKIYFAVEALARYSRDVVIRNEGRWLGYGTRHGVQPWSDGNHEERQTTASEYRLHYFLSGDGRSRDVIELLYNKVYSRRNVKRHASHSGRLMGLLFHSEISNSSFEAEQLKRYVHSFIAAEGIYISPEVSFPGANARLQRKDLNSGSGFFHSFGGMHALIEYYYLTQDPALAEALIKMADHAMANRSNRPKPDAGISPSGKLYWAAIAFAAQHSKDPLPYRNYLKECIRDGIWQALYQPVTRNPAHWTGPTAFLIGNVPDCLFWTNWAPYVTRALDEEPWNDQIARALSEREKYGKIHKKPVVESWQDQFDSVPELQNYFRQPWLQSGSNAARNSNNHVDKN